MLLRLASTAHGVDGLVEVCRRIRETWPDVKVVAFTAHDDEDFRHAAYEAGASGHVWKLLGANELLRPIQTGG